MSIRVYNTLTGKKEDFVPLHDKRVRIYACGVTVYDLCHIGHARSVVVFDSIYRYLRYRGYEVMFVRNFTDIDDKIIKKANEEGIDWKAVAEKYIKEFYVDMGRLGLEKPTFEPRATEHIPGMIRLVSTLIEKGHAYQSGGDVFFSVEKFKDYGKLSKRNIEEMQAGARVEIDEKKENPLDFALWKGSKPGEPFWESPWGKGRPGWHIECSVMSQKYLGETFDIHGGGRDLIFPHHENEIAQSEAATGKEFAKYWVHNGLIQINREKMSKSIGNILNVRDAVAMWNREAIRLFFLSHQYLNPADFSDTTMDESEAALERLYITLKRAKDQGKDGSADDTELAGAVASFSRKWVETMCDDFNTADAIGNLFELTRAVNRSIDSRGWTPALEGALREIGLFGKALGILEYEPEEYLQTIKLQKKSAGITQD